MTTVLPKEIPLWRQEISKSVKVAIFPATLLAVFVNLCYNNLYEIFKKPERMK